VFRHPPQLVYHPPAVMAMRRMWRLDALLLAIMVALSVAAWNLRFSAGVALGGIIILINFQILTATVRRVLAPDHAHPTRTAIMTYYLRLSATALVVAVLIITGVADPIGLLVGLSVVVVGAFVLLFSQLKKNPRREAA
jgi:hypothetical protein